MNHIQLNGSSFSLQGNFLQVGQTAPDFTLTNVQLTDVSLSSWADKKKVLNIFPSIDTPTCAESTRKFNAQTSQIPDTVVLCISADLPFAQSRFCGAEGLDKVMMLSTFRHPAFLTQYGVAIQEGPLAGCAARAVLVLDTDNKILHSQLVLELENEPDYESAIIAAKK